MRLTQNGSHLETARLLCMFLLAPVLLAALVFIPGGRLGPGGQVAFAAQSGLTSGLTPGSADGTRGEITGTAAPRFLPADIFYDSSCADCGPYLDAEIIPAFRGAGVTEIRIHDIRMEREAARAWVALNEELGVPLEHRDHLAVFHGAGLILQGHVPGWAVREVLVSSTRPARLLLHSSGGHGTGHEVLFWDFEHSPETIGSVEGVKNYFRRTPGIPASSIRAGLPEVLNGSRDGTSGPAGTTGLGESGKRLSSGLVLSAGLLDGLNPCAFAVFLFLLAFLWVSRKAARRQVMLAAIYITSIFAVYFLVGMGLLRGFSWLGQTHWLARATAGGSFVFGLLGVVGYFRPGLARWRPGLSPATWDRIRANLVRGAFPTTLAAGVLVGLCTLPCSGFIYVAVAALLAVEGSRGSGLFHLALYNLAYITPLLVIAGLSLNRGTSRLLARLEREHHRLFHLAANISLMVIALALWRWMGHAG